MLVSGDDPVQRFRRRMAGTDEATLHRNLEAGVYGAPGSQRRAVAEAAIRGRFSEAAAALQSAATGSGADARLQSATRLARRAAAVAVVALLLALYAVFRGSAGG